MNTRNDAQISFLGLPTVIRATSESTNGALALVEHLAMPPGFETPYHVHHLEDESFYILEGEASFICDGKWLKAGAGDFVFGPREIPHGFRIEGAAPAKMVIQGTPAGFERFVLEVSSLPPEMEKLIAAAAKYKIDILGPLPPAT